jgi:hypothetical protein
MGRMNNVRMIKIRTTKNMKKVKKITQIRITETTAVMLVGIRT